MAVPERRVRGPLLVISLVIVGIVVTAAVVVLRPVSVLGPPLFLVTAESTISVTPDVPRVPADFGPHCSPYRWLDRQGALAVEANQNFSSTEGLLLQHFAVPANGFRWDGGDAVRPTPLTGGEWNLTSPVDGRVLDTLVRDGMNVTVGGQMYGPGVTWTLGFEYDVTTPQGNVHVIESIVLRNHGVVPTHLVPPEACA